MARNLFALSFLLLLFSCASQAEIQSDFYLGLLDSDENEKVRLFEKALDCSNVYIRRAAADELAVLMVRGTDLSAATKSRISREASPWWIASFEAAKNKNNALSFFLGFEQAGASFNEARLFALQECKKQPEFFKETELAVIEGRNSIFRLRYNEALNHFRVLQQDGVWQEQLPDIFFCYPNLINDLGRAFQHTQSGNEGINLFLQWEANLQSEADNIRHRLLFFAARIAYNRGQLSSAVSLFERALIYAPEGERSDACIWYILDLSINNANVFVDRLEQYVDQWYSGSYFNSLLEKFMQRCVNAEDWNNIIRTFNLIQDSGASALIAGYAWVIVRAIEEDLLSAEEKRLAAAAVNAEFADPLIFTRIAYNAGTSISTPSLYFRLQSADVLELPFLDILSMDSISNEFPPEYSESTAASVRNEKSSRLSSQKNSSQALQFLLGFFSNGAANFAVPYIRSLERELSPDELRIVAQALSDEGMYAQSMRLISLYINREGYVRQRRDLELMFPRPYLELVEKHAEQFGIAPSLLFALIRTESAFQSAVVSRAGAVGLTQLMPATAREMAGRIRRAGGPDFTENLDLSDPSLNIHIGTYYYDYLMRRFNDDLLALMAYNGGMNRVRRWFSASALPVDLFMKSVPFLETRDYGKRVTGAARIYEELYYLN